MIVYNTLDGLSPQASRIIKDTVAKNCPRLSNPDRQQLFSYTMQFVLKHLERIEAFVRRQLSAVAAVLVKRMWLEDDNHDHMLDQCLSQASMRVELVHFGCVLKSPWRV